MYGISTTMPKSRVDRLAREVFKRPVTSVATERGATVDSSNYIALSALFLAIHRRGFEVSLYTHARAADPE